MITSRRVSWVALGAVLPLLSSCNNYLFEQKCPQQIKEQSIVVPALKPTPADILFVVDNSGSMDDEQANLAANFNAFIQQIAGAGDYQIMVVTTDVETASGEQGGRLISEFRDQSPKILVDFNGAGCSAAGIDHGCARGPDPARRIIRSSSMTPEEQIAAFQENVVVGSCGTSREKGLAGMKLALQKTAPGQCNEGFLRAGANLVVVIVSDENDSEANIPVEQYVTDLGAFKDFDEVRVAMIVGAVDGAGASCRIPNTTECGSLCSRRPPDGSGASCSLDNATMPCAASEACERIAAGDPIGRCVNPLLAFWSDCNSCSFYDEDDCCSALDGSRYVDFARQVEARVSAEVGDIPQTSCRGGVDAEGNPLRVACLVDSICQENFAATLAKIARELVAPGEYTLDPPPVYPEGVVVRVKNGRFPAEGLQLRHGEDFTIEGTKLTLTGPNTPVEGEDIEIYYVVDTMSDAPLKGACGTKGP